MRRSVSVVRVGMAIIRSRAILLVGLGLASLGAALAYGLLMPDQYRAVATLFLDSSSLETGFGGSATSSPRRAELDLLRSERVAQRVVENERLAGEAALRAVYLDSIDAGRVPSEALAQYLVDHVSATAAGDGAVVQLAVTLADPELARRVANAYAQAWGEVSLELRAAAIRHGVERAHEDLMALRARIGQARSMRDDGGAMAAAGSRADIQFDQLSRLVAGAPIPGAPTARPPREGLGMTLPTSAEPVASLAPPPADAGDLASSHGALGHPAVESPRQHSAGNRATSADDEIRLAQQSLERAEDRLARLSAEGIGAPFPAHMLRAATVPESSIKPSVAACAAYGAVAALVLGLLALVSAEVLDRRVRRASDLARSTGVMVLGVLPPGSRARHKDRAAASDTRWLRLQRAGNAA